MHTHSAGVGRTGTLITIDSVLEQVEKDGMVDIAGTVNKIRQQRMNMVQTVVSVCVWEGRGVGEEGNMCMHTHIYVCIYTCITYT